MKNSRVCGKIIKSVKSTKKSLHLNRWDSWSCHLINGWCWHLFGLNIDVHIFILGPVLKSQRWAGVREEGACAYTGEEISGSGLSEWYGWIYVEGYTHTHILYLMSMGFIWSSEDLQRLNDKVAEVNSTKMGLQLKLDELESSEVNIKVSLFECSVTCELLNRTQLLRKVLKWSNTSHV